MKKLNMILIPILLLFGCSESEPVTEIVSGELPTVHNSIAKAQSYGDEGLGIRKETLFSEEGVEPPLATFTVSPPGSGVVLDRAYLDAPPQIPHSVVGLLPITKVSNACSACHVPEVAAAIKATPIPASHMRESRVSNARYNCSQCHVPQADVAVLIENNFGE